jgi:hypothetical protein
LRSHRFGDSPQDQGRGALVACSPINLGGKSGGKVKGQHTAWLGCVAPGAQSGRHRQHRQAAGGGAADVDDAEEASRGEARHGVHESATQAR